MFCGKCGLEIKDPNAACPRCGWHLPTDFKKSEKQVIPLQDNFDYDEPSRQDFRRDEFFPPVPEELRLPSQKSARPDKPPKKKKKGKMPLIISLLVVAGILVGVGGILVTFSLHNNSDESKIKKAETEMLAGNFEEGLKIIEDVDDPKANAMRDFANVIQRKDNFMKVFDPNVYQNNDSSVEAAAKELIDSFRSFKSHDDLPKGLKEMYSSICKKMDDRESALAALNKDDLKNAQYCVLEFKLRKEGKHFYISDIEDIIAVSEPAVKSLQEKFINTDAYKKLSGSSKSLAVNDMNTLYTTTSTQVSQDKFDLQEYQKTKKRSDLLWFQSIVRRYDAVVGKGLKYLNGESDLEENAEALYTELSYAWLAYAFE